MAARKASLLRRVFNDVFRFSECMRDLQKNYTVANIVTLSDM